MSKSDNNILFDFLNDITSGKRNILTEENKKSYSAYMINKFLSGHMDCVYQANEMNQRYSLDPRLQYSFLMNSIRKKKRFAPFVKAEKSEEIDLISKYYECNRTRAKEMLQFHSKEDIESIKNFYDVGGIKKKTRKSKNSK